MCGIAGYVSYRTAAETGLIENMTAAIMHRGPDASGCYIHNNLALGHRRLSIIDLSDAAVQPMKNEDGSIIVVFNGEIYNYRHLKSDLELLGHKFHTASDTEVLVHGWEEWAEGLLGRLDGMFAFAIYDRRGERLFLATDPFGKKPLFYYWDQQTFIFGSEIKALRRHPAFVATLNHSAIHQYFAHDYIPAPATVFCNCYKMPSASYLEVSLAKSEIIVPQRYWHLNYEPKSERSFRESVEEFRALFSASVKKRLIGDVPLGGFLSGGIDSSSTVCAMRALLPTEEVHTFSIGFAERSYDESPYARLVAGCFHTQHHELTVSADDVANEMPAVIRHMDEPFADASILPTCILARFARENITVALGGDGGDELLAGYDPFVAHHLVAPFSFLISPLMPALRRLAGLVPFSEKNMSLSFIASHFAQGFPEGRDLGPQIRTALWMGAFPYFDQPQLFQSGQDGLTSLESVYASTFKLRGNPAVKSGLDQLSDWYAHIYLHDDILVKADRASMLSSLELRSPFLDKQLAEFCAALPVSYKYRKRILKEAFRGDLPAAILTRKKKGFGLPIAQWLGSNFKPMLQDLLSSDYIGRQGIFEHSYVSKLMTQHVQKRADHRKKLWALLCFQLWYDSEL